MFDYDCDRLGLLRLFLKLTGFSMGSWIKIFKKRYSISGIRLLVLDLVLGLVVKVLRESARRVIGRAGRKRHAGGPAPRTLFSHLKGRQVGFLVM